MPVIGDVTTQAARKVHRCDWCSTDIPVGERYVRWLWKESNEVAQVKVHEDCQAAWQRDMNNYGWEIEASGEARRGMTTDETEKYLQRHSTCLVCGREFVIPEGAVGYPEVCPECDEKEASDD